eukprot:3399485-Rhodomonas_salina.1
MRDGVKTWALLLYAATVCCYDLGPDGDRSYDLGLTDIVSLDWTVTIDEARERLPKGIGLQGNLVS